jgi:hypothetical protein
LLQSVVQTVAQRRRVDRLILLLAAGATTDGISAVDCGEREAMSLMLAAGVVWSDREIEQALPDDDDDDDDDDDINNDINDNERRMVALAELHSLVPAAKKRIEKFGFAAIRARVLEICIALQDIAMPAPQLIEIVTHACAPFAARLPYHYLWDAVVLVRHFRDRK